MHSTSRSMIALIRAGMDATASLGSRLPSPESRTPHVDGNVGQDWIATGPKHPVDSRWRLGLSQ